MTDSREAVRGGEYAARGDYHRTPDPAWDYYPTYLAKLTAVRRWLGRAAGRARACSTPAAARASSSTSSRPAGDRGDRSRTTRSDRVRAGSVTALPYADGAFDRALCLDVLEHLTFEDQPRALAELYRVLERPAASSSSRSPTSRTCSPACTSCCEGRLIRTASELKHPGDRPVAEYLQLARRAGFELIARARHFSDRPGPDPADPPPSAARCCRCIAGSRALLPVPGWCFLNLLTFRKR